MNRKANPPNRVLIMTGPNPQQYTEARRRLDLLPAEADWLTRPSNLAGKHRPKVFRFGDWKSLSRLPEIEDVLATTEAEIVDL